MTDVKTSLQSNSCQDNRPPQVKRTRGPISEAHLFCARQGAELGALHHVVSSRSAKTGI